MALQGNSWTCSCENVWLGRWLRRWMREALQLHTSVVERGQTIRAVVRTITCKNTDGSERPLVELDNDTPCLLALGVSSAWTPSGWSAYLVILQTVTVISVLRSLPLWWWWCTRKNQNPFPSVWVRIKQLLLDCRSIILEIIFNMNLVWS